MSAGFSSELFCFPNPEDPHQNKANRTGNQVDQGHLADRWETGCRHQGDHEYGVGKGKQAKKFMIPISMAVGVLNAGSTIRSSNGPVAPVLVRYPNMANSFSKP